MHAIARLCVAVKAHHRKFYKSQIKQVLVNTRFNFFCRTMQQDKNGKSPIVLRIVLNNEKRDILPGFIVLLPRELGQKFAWRMQGR
jgi:hypothetical protein